MGRWIVLLITAGCRLGFDNVDPASHGDDQPPGSEGSGSDSNATQLACGGPQRFVVNTDLAGIAAAATSDGYIVTTVDTDGFVKGWSYTLDNGTLTAKAQNISIGASGNGTVGIATAGNTVVVAAQNSAGTTVSAISATDLSSLAPPTVRSDYAGPVPLASVGGTFAYVAQLGDTSIELTQLDAMAHSVGSPVTLTGMPDMAYSPTVVAGKDGYAVIYGGWNLDSGAAIALYDPELAPLVAPQTIEPYPNYFAEQPVVAYAATSSMYLVAWHQKDSMNFDYVYARLLGADLAPVGVPFEIAPYSSNVAIATDGTSFYLSYVTYDPAKIVPDRLVAAQVSSAGVMTPIAIAGDGGTPAKWTFVQRDGQAVLVWQETGGSGPDLYFDPMCGG